jgi:hypothetical protein
MNGDAAQTMNSASRRQKTKKKRLRNREFLQALMPGCRSTVLSNARI